MNESNTASTLSKFNLFAIIVMAVVLIFHEENQARLTDHLYDRIEFGTPANGSMVDFSASEIQSINNRFMLVGATQKKHLTGVIFKGRIINATAIKHTNVEFNLTTSPLSYKSVPKPFIINQISSGNSTSFSVYIPEIDVSDTRHAHLEYVSSTMYYKIK